MHRDIGFSPGTPVFTHYTTASSPGTPVFTHYTTARRWCAPHDLAKIDSKIERVTEMGKKSH